jgi:thioredoxin-like negative regulator of GroEL
MKKENLILFVIVFLAGLIVMANFAPKPKKNVVQPVQTVIPMPAPMPIQTKPVAIDSYATAVQVAKTTNKNILLIFGADWCDWCQKLDMQTLPKLTVQKAISVYIVYHVNVDREPQVATKFGVTDIPRYMVITPAGKVIKDGSGFKNELGFLVWLDVGH